MMTAVIWYCVFNLFWAESCRVYAFSGISLVTFFIKRLQTFFILVTFLTFLTFFSCFERFFTSMLSTRFGPPNNYFLYQSSTRYSKRCSTEYSSSKEKLDSHSSIHTARRNSFSFSVTPAWFSVSNGCT